MLQFAIVAKVDEETTITVRLPASLKKAVEDYALPRGMTLAGIVRRALEDFLDDWPGTLVVVSHDPGVVDSFDTSVPFMDLNRAFSVNSTTPAVGGVA